MAIVALRADGRNIVISARLTFASPTAEVVEKVFESNFLTAIVRRLPDLDGAYSIIRGFAAGSVEIGSQTFEFMSASEGVVAVEFDPIREIYQQSRLSMLTMRGREIMSIVAAPQLDWELKASNPPYLNFNELLLDYGVSIPSANAVFESVHAPPVAIDSDRSKLSHGAATVAIKAERGISTSDVGLSLIGIKAGEPAVRMLLRGDQLTWSDDGKFLVGTTQAEFPLGWTVQATAILRGMAFHYWWLVDPQHVANTRKGIFEVVDPGLVLLREFLAPSSKGGARELESAVAWLLWLLGFGVAHLGSNTRTSDAVDILATTPGGNVALVECTTGVISTDKKIANLLARRAVVVDRLAGSGHNSVRVLPVVVTSLSRPEVAHEIATAMEHGVFVITRDELSELTNQVDLFPNPDAFFAQAEEQLAASAKVAEPLLPGV